MRVSMLVTVLTLLISAQNVYGMEVPEPEDYSISVVVPGKDVFMSDRGIFFRYEGDMYSCTSVHVTEEGIVASDPD